MNPCRGQLLQHHMHANGDILCAAHCDKSIVPYLFSPALHKFGSVLQAVLQGRDWPRRVCHAMRVTRWQAVRRAAPHLAPRRKGWHPATSVLAERQRQQHCSTGDITIWAMFCCQAKLYRRAAHLYAVCCIHGNRPVS